MQFAHKLTPRLLLPTLGLGPFSSEDPRPFLRRCFPSVADLAKGHWLRDSRRRTAPSSCKNMRWSSGDCVECTFDCVMTTRLCSAAKQKTRSCVRSMRPLQRRSRCKNSSMNLTRWHSMCSMASTLAFAGFLCKGANVGRARCTDRSVLEACGVLK